MLDEAGCQVLLHGQCLERVRFRLALTIKVYLEGGEHRMGGRRIDRRGVLFVFKTDRIGLPGASEGNIRAVEVYVFA